jgi:ABC-type proline/glycine betaine transport system ATPase subunit
MTIATLSGLPGSGKEELLRAVSRIFGPTVVADGRNSGVSDVDLHNLQYGTQTEGAVISIQMNFFEAGLTRVLKASEHSIIERR